MSNKAEETAKPSRTTGSQTLARGLRALEIVAASPEGVSIQDVATALDVHRTIAYRLLGTLADFKLVARGSDGRFRAAGGLAALAQGVQSSLRDVAEPYLRELARALQSTVALLIAEGDEAVAISVVEPPNSSYHLAFRAGSRHPLDRGAAGHALLAAGPARPGEPEAIATVRAQGYAVTHGEVEPGAYGVAAPLRQPAGMPAACINVITYRPELAEQAAPALLTVVKQIEAEVA